MSEIQRAPLASIDTNPFRQVGRYPFVERKLDALKRSIEAVGLWEGVIARPVGNRFQIAFGHHRIEAARRFGLLDADLIIRDLTDEQMLQFMGRENMEDYNADFLCMLETWEATVSFLVAARRQNQQAVEVARFLGWTEARSDREGPIASHTARACSAAASLIEAGHVSRDDLRDLTVRASLEILERTQQKLDQLDRAAKARHTPAPDLRAARAHIAKAAVTTAGEARRGEVSQRKLRGQVDVNAFRYALQAKRRTPLFDEFARDLANNIARMLSGDSAADRLAEMVKAIPDVTLDDDKQAVVRIEFELGALAERAGIWRKRITSSERKVSHLQIAKGE
jgi:ParB-like chromosome segregation protein Spo0J